MNQTEKNLFRIRQYNKALDAWKEEEHPRDKNGRFKKGEGESSLEDLAESTKNMGWLPKAFGMRNPDYKADPKIPKAFDAKMEKKLSSCKTSEDVYWVLRNSGILSRNAMDFTNLPKDLEAAKICVRGLNLAMQTYPQLKGCLTKGVTLAAPEEIDNNIAAYNISGKNGVVLSIIKLNEKDFSNGEELRNKYEQDVNNKLYPKGTTADNILIHEMGHAIVTYINQFIPKGQNFDFCKYLYYNVCGLGDKSIDYICDNLSEYANNDVEDFVAEAFSESMTSESPRPLARMVRKEIDAFMNTQNPAEYMRELIQKSRGNER